MGNIEPVKKPQKKQAKAPSVSASLDEHARVVAEGLALFGRRQFAEAAESFRAALRLQPADAGMWSNFSAALNEIGRVDDAIGAAREALRLAPDMFEAWNNLGAVLDRAGRPMEAVVIYEQALRLNPTADVWNNLGNAHKAAGRVDQAVACYRQAIRLRPDYWRVWSNMLFVMNYSDAFSLSDIAAEHRAFGAAIERGVTAVAPAPSPQVKTQLRVGFVSADFYNHPVGRLLLPLLQAPRSGKVAYFLYASNVVRDRFTERLTAAAEGIRWLQGGDDEGFSRVVKDDGIDVLIDLAGHTAGNRLPAFARRLAPVQVEWLGYAFTSGLSAMDYVIGDPVSLPDEDVEYYTETPVRLPNYYLLAGAPETGVKTAPPPMLRQGYVTFGSFNNPAKISPRVFAAWVDLLKRLPEARLLMKSKAFGEPGLCKEFSGRFAQAGIAPSRLSFEGQSWGDAYFESFGRIDVALDPFPFPGLMTTLDTLWMGVPVVMLQERAGMLGRHGARMLELIGHADWVASDTVGYIERAVDLVSDAARLATLRSGLRARLQSSAVMDAPGFSAAFESLLMDLAGKRGITLAKGEG